MCARSVILNHGRHFKLAVNYISSIAQMQHFLQMGAHLFEVYLYERVINSFLARRE